MRSVRAEPAGIVEERLRRVIGQLVGDVRGVAEQQYAPPARAAHEQRLVPGGVAGRRDQRDAAVPERVERGQREAVERPGLGVLVAEQLAPRDGADHRLAVGAAVLGGLPLAPVGGDRRVLEAVQAAGVIGVQVRHQHELDVARRDAVRGEQRVEVVGAVLEQMGGREAERLGGRRC